MIHEIFDWCPQVGAEGTSSFRVFSAQFGDGYAQEVGDGINNERQTWPLQFTGGHAYVQAIRNFLRAHAGFRPFLWTPPMGEEGLYVCREYTIRAIGNEAYTLSATFEQRFA